MSIDIMVILIVVAAMLVVTMLSIFSGIVAVRNSIEKSQETDLLLISDIADHFISSEIDALKMRAAFMAQALGEAKETEWREIMLGQQIRHPEFIGMAVLGHGGEVAAVAGELPADARLLANPQVKLAFQGKTRLSTTIPSSSGVVFYLATPIPETPGRILVITLPGMFFSEMISTFVVWETGHIFIDDAEGHVIANRREAWVQNRHNFIRLAQADRQYEETARVIERGVGRETGIGFFSVSGVPRICAIRPITGSAEGWFLGVVAPLPESPFRNDERGLIGGGLAGILRNVISAIIASGFVKKPFNRRARLAELEERAETANRAKSAFLATMSHELRTPMNAILGLTEIQLQSAELSAETKNTLQTIYNSGHSLLHIINDLLDLSKIEAGKLELFNGQYETASLINDTAHFNLPLIGGKPIVFRLQVDEDMFLKHSGDEQHVKQILNHLLSNAFKFTDRGEVRLSTGMETAAGWDGREGAGDGAPEVTLVFAVRDTGRGMTAEQVQNLFDEYSHVHLQANRLVEGTGLGLNIVRHLVKMMGGEISVASAPGQGTEVMVRLRQGYVGPARLGKELALDLMNFRLPVPRETLASQVTREHMPYGRVLVVDDMETNLYVARGFLSPYGLAIDTANSGMEAVEKIGRGDNYDIVFMDHMMPEMDGMEAVKIIREKGYARPIVALTANAIAGQAELFMVNGFDGFLAKPIDVRAMDASLNKFIRDRQPPEVLAAARAAAGRPAEATREEPQVDAELAKIFLRDAEKTAAILESYENGGSYELGDLKMYVLNVHALKSALANIGETKLSGVARDLEQAGRDRDTAFMARETRAFLGGLRAVMDKLRPGAKGKYEGDVSDADLAFLRETLRSVKLACAEHDAYAAKSALLELRGKPWSGAYDELFDKISEHLLHSDFEEADAACAAHLSENG